MLLTAGRLIKYDLKELFKKHIALYIVTLLAAFVGDNTHIPIYL